MSHLLGKKFFDLFISFLFFNVLLIVSMCDFSCTFRNERAATQCVKIIQARGCSPSEM